MFFTVIGHAVWDIGLTTFLLYLGHLIFTCFELFGMPEAKTLFLRFAAYMEDRQERRALKKARKKRLNELTRSRPRQPLQISFTSQLTVRKEWPKV